VEPNVRTFTAGQKTKVEGVIVSRDGQTLKLRGTDDSIGTVDLNENTKIQLKHGFLIKRKAAMNTDSLVAGLRVEVEGSGNEKGELVADKVIFDPNSMRASRQIDTRVSPLEARTGTLEGRTGTLESRAGKIEGRQTELEGAQKQTEQHVGEVRQVADQANQGVSNVNRRVSDLDNYQEKYKETVYFAWNSAKLTPAEQQKLDQVIQQTKNEKGYVVEVAGYADKTGKADYNQTLSERRADAVVRYLEQNGDIPIHRILTPAAMGTSHEAADNSTSEGRKLNRRVEVKVLVNQGVVGSSGSGSATPSTAAGASTPTGTTPASTTTSTGNTPTSTGSNPPPSQNQPTTPPAR
jgi:outer membrane protein OmpA-like peptidoglycan-associated protein